MLGQRRPSLNDTSQIGIMNCWRKLWRKRTPCLAETGNWYGLVAWFVR
jgi:hypothetical protein